MQGTILIHLYNRDHGTVYVATDESSLLSSILQKLAISFALAGFLVLSISFAPSAWYYLSGGRSDAASKLIVETAQKPNYIVPTEPTSYEPRFDPRLSGEPKLKIASIGVDSQIQEATYDNYGQALKKGVWRVSDFGTPTARERPIILAAHRFGYLTWSIPFRLKNSFFNLPKVYPGDLVEIDWNQRKYLYEVYAESRGEAIENYPADLILYTCESLAGPARVFKYARLLEI
ncbi:hypothetical protein HYZ70_02675 [Candidatus Curtissbacteria bacterium]|nr:hypothetical protein [Candidatus Curtissbacteria bacterium]